MELWVYEPLNATRHDTFWLGVLVHSPNSKSNIIYNFLWIWKFLIFWGSLTCTSDTGLSYHLYFVWFSFDGNNLMLFWNFKISICKKIIKEINKIELFIIQTCNFRVLPCYVAYIFFLCSRLPSIWNRGFTRICEMRTLALWKLL